jgi:hypothetical protein
MKIEQTQIWKDGEIKTATQINAKIVSDNLVDSANFYFELITENDQRVSDGNMIITGEDYENWFSNEDAYTYICNKLNLIIKPITYEDRTDSQDSGSN